MDFILLRKHEWLTWLKRVDEDGVAVMLTYPLSIQDVVRVKMSSRGFLYVFTKNTMGPPPCTFLQVKPEYVSEHMVLNMRAERRDIAYSRMLCRKLMQDTTSPQELNQRARELSALNKYPPHLDGTDAVWSSARWLLEVVDFSIPT